LSTVWYKNFETKSHLFVVLLPNTKLTNCFNSQVKSILKGSDDVVMHFEESCFRTLSIVQCFFFKNVSEVGSASVFR
jgi:hypothetical protein